jgi:hypothetical protein
MSMNASNLLKECFTAKGIPLLNPGGGSWGARAGLAYEEYIKSLFADANYAHYNSLLSGAIAPVTMDDDVVYHILRKAGVTSVENIIVEEVPSRSSGGNPKTDVWIVVNNQVNLRMSVKRSHASSIAVSEFDVDTMASEIGLANPRLLYLMRKHQADKSAKYFSSEERTSLTDLLAPHRRSLVTWALSGCKEAISFDPRHANFIVMFKTDRHGRLLGFGTETVEESVDHLTTRSSGFNTGLSWTYATGSGGTKIQFKAPVLQPQVWWDS